jgi:hypothetical protein
MVHRPLTLAGWSPGPSELPHPDQLLMRAVTSTAENRLPFHLFGEGGATELVWQRGGGGMMGIGGVGDVYAAMDIGDDIIPSWMQADFDSDDDDADGIAMGGWAIPVVARRCLDARQADAAIEHVDAATLLVLADDDLCPICLSCLNDGRECNDGVVRIRRCRHAFCDRCVRRWFQRSTSCPVCKVDLALVEEDADVGEEYDGGGSGEQQRRRRRRPDEANTGTSTSPPHQRRAITIVVPEEDDEDYDEDDEDDDEDDAYGDEEYEDNDAYGPRDEDGMHAGWMVDSPFGDEGDPYEEDEYV